MGREEDDKEVRLLMSGGSGDQQPPPTSAAPLYVQGVREQEEQQLNQIPGRPSFQSSERCGRGFFVGQPEEVE